jgi:hypothetical protein
MNILVKQVLAFWALVPIVYLGVTSNPALTTALVTLSIVEDIVTY